ncbi:MAG: virulence protein [Clostridia bacterium]|nr:virulence protein [Clostridia bacterium]
MEEAGSEEEIKSEEELPADTAASDECSDEETLSDPDEPAEDESDEATSNEETEQDEPVSDSEPGDASDHETSETPDDGKTHITLSLPRFQFTFSAIERLKAIVQSKQTLLKKALDTDTLDVQLTDDKVLFPWFTDHGLTGEADAYSKLVFAIAKLAVNQKRASAEEKQNDNEKLAMRLFLIRLGFIGDEYKTARAILTRNFTGNSAWKNSPNGKDSAPELSLPEVFISNTYKGDSNA